MSAGEAPERAEERARERSPRVVARVVARLAHAIRAQARGQKSAPGRPVARWLAFAMWVVVLCALGTTYVAEKLSGPRLLTVALCLALVASLCLGGLAGLLRDRTLLLTAGVTGALLLTGTMEAAWVASFFEPLPGGSGGFGEVFAPFFIAVLCIPFFLIVMTVVLGLADLFGLALSTRR
jgi:hypothetical protein